MTPAQLQLLLRSHARANGTAKGADAAQHGGVHDLLQFQSMRRA